MRRPGWANLWPAAAGVWRRRRQDQRPQGRRERLSQSGEAVALAGPGVVRVAGGVLEAGRRRRCGGGELFPWHRRRLGIGYREVKARRPDIVYCSVSSYGQFGPWKNGRGWERQGQAVAGIMERQTPPAILGPYNLIDIGTGTLATFATGLGLYHRLARATPSRAGVAVSNRATYQQTPYVLQYTVSRRHHAASNAATRVPESLLPGPGSPVFLVAPTDAVSRWLVSRGWRPTGWRRTRDSAGRPVQPWVGRLIQRLRSQGRAQCKAGPPIS